MGDVFNVLAGLYLSDESVRNFQTSVGVGQAAATTATMLAEVYSDFEENSGLEFKMLLNDVQKEVQ